MKTYKISVTSHDGVRATIYGIYSDAFAAVLDAMDRFRQIKCISARRLP